MIFTGRSVDALDEVRDTSGIQSDGATGHRDVSAVAIAAGWFSSLRRPGKRRKNYQKQAKSAWDLSVLSTATVSRPNVKYVKTHASKFLRRSVYSPITLSENRR